MLVVNFNSYFLLTVISTNVKLFKLVNCHTITTKDCSSVLKNLENYINPKILLDLSTVLRVDNFIICLYLAFFKFHNLCILLF